MIESRMNVLITVLSRLLSLKGGDTGRSPGEGIGKRNDRLLSWI